MTELDELWTEALHDLAAEAPRLPPLSPRVRRRIRTGQVGAIVASVVIVAGACAGLAIGVQALNRAPHPERNSPNPAPWTATVRAGIRLPVSQSTDVAVLGSTAWVADWYTGKVVRADLAARRVTKVLRIGRPQDGPISIATGAGSLWVLDFSAGKLLRISPATGMVTSRIQLPGAVNVAYGDGFVWVISDGPFNGKTEEHLYKIDPARNAIARVAPIPGAGPDCAASPGPQGVWVGCGGVAGITLIDPASLKPLKSWPINRGSEYTPQIAPGRRVVWVLTGAGLVRIDPATGKITAPVQTTWDPQADAIPSLTVDSSGRVWVAGSPLNVLVPGTLTTHLVAHAPRVTNVVVANSNLWIDTGTTLAELNVSPLSHHARHREAAPAVGAPGFPADVYPPPRPHPVVNSIGHCPAADGLQPFTTSSGAAARDVIPKLGHSRTQDLRLSDRAFWPVLASGWQGGANRVFTPGRPPILYSGPLESYHSSAGPPDFTKLISAACGARLAHNTWMMVDGPRRSPALQGELLFLNRRGHILLYYAQ